MGLLSKVYHYPCPKDKFKLVEEPSMVLMEFNELIAFIEGTHACLQKYESSDLKKFGVSAPRECSFSENSRVGENLDSQECNPEYSRRGLYQLDTSDFIFQLGVWQYGEATRIWINQRAKNDKGLGDKLIFEFYGEKYLSGEELSEIHFSFGNEDMVLGTSGDSSYLEVYLPHTNDKVVFKDFKNGNGQYVIEPKSEEECSMSIGGKTPTCDEGVKGDALTLFSCTTYSGLKDATNDFKSKTSTFKEAWNDILDKLGKAIPHGFKTKVKNG